MSVRSDGRIAATGKHPDIAGLKRPTNRDVVDAQDLIRTMHSNHTPSDPVAGEFSSVEDAASAFGLDAEKTRIVESLIGDVVKDVRDMVLVAKAAREAALPSVVVPELIRRGVRLRERLNKSLSFIAKGKSLPIGSERSWGGRTYVKGSDGKWKQKGKGSDKGTDDKPKPKPNTEEKEEKVADDKGGKSASGDDKKDDDKKGKKDKPKGGDAGGKEADNKGGEDESEADRFERIKQEAKDAGINVTGELKDHHDHKHLDRLEARIKKKAAQQAQAGAEQEDGANPMDVAPSRPEGHDSPVQPHEVHRLQQEVHDLRVQLAQIKDRLDSPHQKGMYRQLDQESKEVAKDPSPQALSWLGDRINAFVTLVTGLAAEKVGDSFGARGKGGDKPDKGEKDKPGGGKPVDRRKEGYKAGEEDPAGWGGDKGKKGDKAKKSLYVDKRGRLVMLSDRIEKAGGWSPIPGGKHGGERKRKGNGYEYRYPSKEHAQHANRYHRDQHQSISRYKDSDTSMHHREVAAGALRASVSGHPTEETHDFQNKAPGSVEIGDTIAVAYDTPGGMHGAYDSGPAVYGKVTAITTSKLQSGTVAYQLNTDHGNRVVRNYAGSSVSVVTPKKKVSDSGGKPPVDYVTVSSADLDSYPNGTVIETTPKKGVNRGKPVMARKRGDGAWDIHWASSKGERDMVLAGRARGVDENKTARGVLFRSDQWRAYDPDRPADKKPTKAKSASKLGVKRTAPKPKPKAKKPPPAPSKNKAKAKKKAPPTPAVKKPKTRTTGGNHAKNEHGHKHDLKPGDILTTRSRHGSETVVVHIGGKFEHKGEIHRNTNALLNDIHGVGTDDGPKRHGTTFGRYFGLTKQERTTRKAIRELATLMKSRHVAVRMDRGTDDIELLGNLEKAGVPPYMLPYPGSPRAVIDSDAAIDLIQSMRGSGHE